MPPSRKPKKSKQQQEPTNYDEALEGRLCSDKLVHGLKIAEQLA